MASDVSQRAREAAASLIERYWSGSDAAMMQLAKAIRAGQRAGAFTRTFSDFEAEIRAETALPPILIDPTGKGYPTDERPMTVAEFEAVIRADATAIERERCASFIEQNVPVSSNQDDLPAYFGPRRGGNLVGLEYAAAIRKGPTP